MDKSQQQTEISEGLSSLGGPSHSHDVPQTAARPSSLPEDFR